MWTRATPSPVELFSDGRIPTVGWIQYCSSLAADSHRDFLGQPVRDVHAGHQKTGLDKYSVVYIIRSLGMAKPDSLQGSLDLLVLKILSRRPGLHGYAIMAAIQEISREVLRVEEGSLYPALHRMESEGWIQAEWVTKDSGRRARIYRLTEQGGIQLAASESRWLAVADAVGQVLRMA